MGESYSLSKRRFIRENKDFICIDEAVMKKIQKAYSQSRNRLIIIDHEGALPRKFEALPEPSPYILNILKFLSEDPQNSVFVVSPYHRRQVHVWFSNHAKKLGLAAEDGYQYRFNSQFKSEYEWQRLIEITKDHAFWLAQVENIMGMYVERLDGSCIDRRESSVVFDFSDCSDNQYGHMIAKELYKHIETLIANGFQIQRVFGQTYVEVKPLELKKSLVLERILSAITVYRKKVDFLLYIGDDSSNEEVFSCLRSYQQQNQTHELRKYLCSHVFTCTVGKKPSNARYFLKDQLDMSLLLRGLASLSHQNGQAASAGLYHHRLRKMSATAVCDLKSFKKGAVAVPLQDRAQREKQDSKSAQRSSSAPNHSN